MAENKVLLKLIENLAQLDIDAVHAYTSAIERIDIVDVKERLMTFRRDHERHIHDLTPLIVRMGGKPPKHSPDFKGFLIQGFTAIKSMISNESALKAMKSNEELTNRTYEKALQSVLPEDVRVVVQRNCDDERKHLQYVNQCIERRVWQRIPERPGKKAA